MRTKVRLAIILLILLPVALALAPMAALAQSEEEFGSFPFAESIDELPEELHPGQVYKGYPNWKMNDIGWAAIPGWMAGNWKATDTRIIKTFKHADGTVRGIPTSVRNTTSAHFGDLMDSRGTIWMGLITPYVVNEVMEGDNDAQDVVGMRPLEVQDGQVALWQRIIHIIYSSGDNLIKDAYTEERVSELSLVRPGMMQARITYRNYDHTGEATWTVSAIRIMRQTSAFRPLATRLGVDLKNSLYAYFRNTGNQVLIPGEAARSSNEF